MTGTGIEHDLMVLDGLTVVDDDHAVGVRNVPTTWDVLATHFPRKPVVPGVVVLGCLERVAQALLAQRTGTGGWHLGGIRRARFRHFVQPGDRMELAVEVGTVDADAATLKATVRVDGTPVVTVSALAMARTGAG